MLTSINPLGERGRNQSYVITAGAYVAASTVAGAALGGLLGALGGPFAGAGGREATIVIVIVALTVVGLALDAHVLGWRVPGPRRQVNEDWLATYRGWVYGAGYGAQLGFGFTTIVESSLTWVAFACALGSGSAGAGLLIGATFGLARAIPVLAMARTHDFDALRTRMARLDRARPRVTRGVVAFQAAIALGLLAIVTGGST